MPEPTSPPRRTLNPVILSEAAARLSRSAPESGAERAAAKSKNLSACTADPKCLLASGTTRFSRIGFFACCFCVALLLAAAPPARATIRYEISLARPSDHVFHVAMTIPNVRGTLELQIPAWDALYQIRDFGYHMMDLRAADAASSRALRVTRLDKGTWRIETAGNANAVVRVEYATYWDESGPFSSQLNEEHAFLNLAMVLCYVPDRRAESAELRLVDVPQNWRVAVELPEASSAPASSTEAAPNAKGAAEADYLASGYDTLVDAPVEAGRFEEVDFTAANRPIRVIVHGDIVDRTRLTQQLSQIVEYEARMMGGAPFQEYMFLFHFGRGSGGGMEHANCTAIFVPNQAAILNVSAHEFFHLWNVKRIRPQSLEPIDYTKEMWTPSLWFAEGVTNTYAAYTLVRTGLWSKAEFLSDLSEQINDLEARPARRWQSAEESSRDAWLEKYPLYNQPDHSISYYNKGQLLGLGLDILIRDASDNAAGLDDVLRRLNEQYAERGRFYPDSAGIRGAAEDVLRAAGADGQADLDAFFVRYVAGTDELPLADWLSRAGLSLGSSGQQHATLGFSISRNASGAAVVSDLDLDSSAARNGIREGDVVESLDGGDVQRDLARWLNGHAPGDVVRASTRRGDSQSDLSFTLGAEAARNYQVEEAPQPTARQRAILNGLLQGTTTSDGR